MSQHLPPSLQRMFEKLGSPTLPQILWEPGSPVSLLTAQLVLALSPMLLSDTARQTWQVWAQELENFTE